VFYLGREDSDEVWAPGAIPLMAGVIPDERLTSESPFEGFLQDLRAHGRGVPSAEVSDVEGPVRPHPDFGPVDLGCAGVSDPAPASPPAAIGAAHRPDELHTLSFLDATDEKMRLA
jgi:hypothetical protein